MRVADAQTRQDRNLSFGVGAQSQGGESRPPEFTPHTHRVVSLEEAHELQRRGAEILWRPEGREEAIVLEEPIEL